MIGRVEGYGGWRIAVGGANLSCSVMRWRRGRGAIMPGDTSRRMLRGGICGHQRLVAFTAAPAEM